MNIPVFHGEADVKVELSVVPDRLVVRDDVKEHRRRPGGRGVDPDGAYTYEVHMDQE